MKKSWTGWMLIDEDDKEPVGIAVEGPNNETGWRTGFIEVYVTRKCAREEKLPCERIVKVRVMEEK